jgi:hypothetical protein
MTWQRIDENTYIDDTLVTCAEYQLFIDEMREQGKYYQPDHWTSYQFPEGAAKEPILGVRHSSAAAFCEWLTQRAESGWNYCLPNQKDVRDPKLPVYKGDPLSYWINPKFEFMWVGNVPTDARRIAISFTHEHKLVHELTDALARARNLCFDMDQTFARHRTLQQGGKNVYDVDTESIWYLLLNFPSARTLRHDHTQILTTLLALAQGIHNKVHDRYISNTLRATFKRALDLALDIYIDIITLQERIAGRSPAFEGIRLVKERIR